jgi:uncharacterized phage protein (TIGR01671 family)
MSREIKFRAWDSEAKEMRWIVSDIHWALHGITHCTWVDGGTLDSYRIVNDGDCVGGRDRFILMQFTGLVDKDGKEIYEGDIITIDSEFDKKHYKGNVYWNWKLGMFRMKSFDRESFFGVLLTQPHYEAKVIGNIFQNPELLKEAK